jgi:flavin reductase (DIM6/NTAB) family NADH-FMN oxidoreductase RutF
MPISLVTAKHGKVRNVMTAAWTSPSSFDPPLISITIGTGRFTHDLIMKSKEFAINVLSPDQMDLAIFCGNISGREVDKFKEKKISIRSAKKIKAPLINGCAANIECKVRHYYLTGDHTVFVGRNGSLRRGSFKSPFN